MAKKIKRKKKSIYKILTQIFCGKQYFPQNIDTPNIKAST